MNSGSGDRAPLTGGSAASARSANFTATNVMQNGSGTVRNMQGMNVQQAQQHQQQHTDTTSSTATPQMFDDTTHPNTLTRERLFNSANMGDVPPRSRPMKRCAKQYGATLNISTGEMTMCGPRRTQRTCYFSILDLRFITMWMFVGTMNLEVISCVCVCVCVCVWLSCHAPSGFGYRPMLKSRFQRVWRPQVSGVEVRAGRH